MHRNTNWRARARSLGGADVSSFTVASATSKAKSHNRGATVDPALASDWHVVAYSSDVPEGRLVPIQLFGEALVAWRQDGKVHVWKDLCIHRGARLSKGWIVDGAVVCPYHGWRYDSRAQCILIPAHPDDFPPPRARAFPYRAEERYGFIWVCLADPAQDIPVFPEWDSAEFRIFYAGPYPFNANVFRSIENFIDTTHFPFVHAGLNGVIAKPEKLQDYVVTRGPEGLSTSGIRVYQPSGDFREVPINAEYRFRCLRPTTAYFSKNVRIADAINMHLGNDYDRFCTLLTAQPVDEFNCIIRLAIAINFGAEFTREDIVRRQDIVFAQDREIVETQHPELIPLDLREELHIRSDRLAVAYRRWLKELGITYGTYGD
jgi:phenylpropionate dioxygenase-like ring-hydroxylating dioxygenase large terminal subunit